MTLAPKSIDSNLGDGYLRFQLNKQAHAVLPMRYTQEAIVVPVEAVSSIPNMPLVYARIDELAQSHSLGS
jgi:positive phototaxis protein PixI